MNPAELAIYHAIGEIEKIGADVRLTQAQTLLQQAKDLVSDYLDDKEVDDTATTQGDDSQPTNPGGPPIKP